MTADDPDGLSEFVTTQQRGLLRSAWLLTGNWASAEDLVQNALARVWPRWSAIAPPARLSYVRRTMMSLFLNEKRRRWSGEVPFEVVPDSAVVADPADLRASVRSALDALPPRQRAVVVLRYFVDLTEADTAAALDCSVGTVKSTASAALARLRTMPGLAELLVEGAA